MSRKNWLSYFDYFFITRPMLFFPGWSTLLAGYMVVSGQNNLQSFLADRGVIWQFPESSVFYSALAFAAAMGASFILNQLHDVETDRHNEKLFLLEGKHIGKPAAIVESTLLILISMGFSLLVNSEILFLNIAFIFITGYLYNFPPFEFKNRPWWGSLLNMLMGWIAFALGWTIVGNLNLQLLLYSLPYFFLNSGLCFLTTLPDMGGDRAANKTTLSVRYGIKLTIWLSIFSYVASLISGLLLSDRLILLIDLLTLWWILRMAFKPTVSAAVKVVKMAILFFSLAVCTRFPFYFVVMILIFFFTKFYYRQRFQFDYPNFRGD